ncbi:MAG: hypothetical protein J7K46_06595 [Bacteroidales bacterium]|nr:hypothetical protein [Bacteroidales bacterium]
MKLKMIQRVLIRIFLLALIAVSWVSCKSGEKKEQAEESAVEVDVSQLNDEMFKDINEAKQIFYSLPSPLETAMLIKSTGVGYNEDLLNSVDNVTKYSTTKSMALNLGIYTCDLSFASLYDQTQSSIDYMNAAKKMADGLGILDAISQENIDRLEENINNRDVIMDIISETFMNSSSYLQENDRSAVAAIVLVGGWMEGLYLATQLVPDTTHLENNKLIQRIVDQKLSLNIVERLLNDNEDNQDIQAIMKDINEIQAIYDKIPMKASSSSETSTDDQTHVTTIKSASNYKITWDLFNELKETVKVIRNNYIS